MTPEEMAEHRAKMRSLQTNEEREAYRLEHHQMMQERAREQGVTLPDEPPTAGRQGGGMGMGRDGCRQRHGHGGGAWEAAAWGPAVGWAQGAVVAATANIVCRLSACPGA